MCLCLRYSPGGNRDRLRLHGRIYMTVFFLGRCCRRMWLRFSLRESPFLLIHCGCAGRNLLRDCSRRRLRDRCTSRVYFWGRVRLCGWDYSRC